MSFMESMKYIGFQILRKMKKLKPKRYGNSDSEVVEEFIEYDFIIIQNATNNFSETNKIGEGGFGAVYKGMLEDGQQIAVKRLSKNSRPTFMANLQHMNLVRLLGFSLEGKEVLLVYEFVPSGSLDEFLFDPLKRECLNWERRYKIIECIARGLIYLHEGSRIRIIHCNLKASNVLLDENLNPKIVDFAMGNLFALEKIHDSTCRIMRTSRYMAPEYVLHGEISVKLDVYSFGILVMEIISGQKIAGFQIEKSTSGDLLSNAWTHWKGGSALNVIDPMLRDIKSPVDEITRCIHIALLCVQESVPDRPKMIEVLQMLNNLSISLPEPLKPGLLISGSISPEVSSQFTNNVKSISDQYQYDRKIQKKAKSYAKTDPEEINFWEESVEFDFIIIQNATDNFSETNMIGGGGFGVVYKGTFEDGQEVAVKRLSQNSKGSSQEFKNEVALMVKFQHRNLVRLFGFSLEGKEVFLVYEFVPNGNLNNFLYGFLNRERFDWERRYKIIECIARGLVYLHEGSRIRIIHCNLKASNILLDEKLNPKIVDFAMSKLFALDKIHDSTIMRTSRYMAPEYALHGEISIKSDTYSFGILVMEIISGQKIAGFQIEKSTSGDLLTNAWTHWKGGSALNVIDPMLRDIKSPVDEITRCIHIALLCVQESVPDRPKMIEVLQMLNNLSIRLPEPLDPGLFIRGSNSSEASSQFTKNVKKKAKSYAKTMEESSSSVEINPVESHLKYELITIQNATNNFSQANKLGEGEYGPVYKGKLENGLEVAVKRLSENSWLGSSEFKNELTLVAKLQHKNLITLFGYCQEGREVILVYEFLPNGSLDGFLFDPVKCGYLDWERRYIIIKSIGKGLVYLHEDSRLRIVHRDIKASSILLDADLIPKIADFGLAWWSASDETQYDVEFVRGTCGYLPPEYLQKSELSIKTDVYSFGVLVLEIICGQICFDRLNERTIGRFLTSYAWKQWINGSPSNIIHPMLRGVSSPVDDIIKCIQVALLCIQEKAENRPTMSEVVQMLSNLSMSLPVPLAPPELVPPGLDDDCSTVVCSEGSINEMSVREDDEYLR